MRCRGALVVVLVGSLLGVAPSGSSAAPVGVTTACIGDGTSGNRVQLVYVRQESQPSRMAEQVPRMRHWAEQIDKMFLRASLDTGGHRRVRWVTDPDCLPTVVEHVVPDGMTEFPQVLVDLTAAGLRPLDRKLLVAHEVGTYCGLGDVETDDRPGLENLNNTQTQALTGAVAEPCWDWPLAAHELGHTLGAVQPSAPNATPGHHCTDEFDVMCYNDGTGGPVREVCAQQEGSLDCGFDDYFNVDPPEGSYLDTHWNVANSSFLDTAPWALPPDRPERPVATARSGSVQLHWEPPLFDGGDPVTGYLVTILSSGETRQTGPEPSLLVDGLADGEAVSFSVQAVNGRGAGEPSIATDPVTPTPAISAVAGFQGQEPTSVASRRDGTTWVGTAKGLVRVSPTGARRLLSGPGALQSPLPEGTRVGSTPMRPVGLARHPRTSDLYVVDRLSKRVRVVHQGRVRSVTPAWMRPSAIAFSSRGRLFVVETARHRVWKRVSGSWVRVAGSPTGQAGFSGDGGAARRALLSSPNGVAIDGAGRVYISDRDNHRVRRVDRGVISTFAGNGAAVVIPGTVFDGTESIFLLLPRPTGISFGNGRVYVQSAGRVLAIRPDTIQVTYVGSPGQVGDTGDGGPARDARIGDDTQLAMSGRRLVILDRVADRVRRVAAPAS